MYHTQDSSSLLENTLNRIGREHFLKQVGCSERTLLRWKKEPDSIPRPVLFSLPHLSTPVNTEQGLFTFIDLFAGIGGIRLGFEKHGGKCVFTSEWNKFSQQTYRENFPDEHGISGDITAIDAASIPDHDVLLAGFPCQPLIPSNYRNINSPNYLQYQPSLVAFCVYLQAI